MHSGRTGSRMDRLTTRAVPLEGSPRGRVSVARPRRRDGGTWSCWGEFFAGCAHPRAGPCVRFRRHDRRFPTHPLPTARQGPCWDLGPDYGYNGHEPHPPSLLETASRASFVVAPQRLQPGRPPQTKITGGAFPSTATDFVQVDKTIGISCFPASRREVASPGPLPAPTPLGR
jgi:hypothetical protein